MLLEVPLYENNSYIKPNQIVPSITDVCYCHYITLQGVKCGLVVKRHNSFLLMARIEAPLLPSSLTQSGTHYYRNTSATNTRCIRLSLTIILHLQNSKEAPACIAVGIQGKV